MSTLRINNITDKAGKQGPVIAGVTTVSSTSHMVIPSGHTGQKYTDNGEGIVRNGLAFYVDAKYSLNSTSSPGTLYDMGPHGLHVALFGSPSYDSDGGGSIIVNESSGTYGRATREGHEFETGYGGPFTMEVWAKQTTQADWAWALTTRAEETGIGFHGSSGTPSTLYGRNGGGGRRIQFHANATNNTWWHIALACNTTGQGPIENQTGQDRSTAFDIRNDGTMNQGYYESPPGRHAYSSHLAKGYRNGNKVWEKDIGGADYSRNNEIQIGRWSSGEHLTGKVAIARIYNRCLSEGEILKNYNAQKARFGL